MRADAHYVDQLTARRETVHTDAPRAARRTDSVDAAVADRDRRDPRELERDVHAVRDPRLEWLLTHLLDEVATIQSSAALLSGAAATLARRANVDAIRAHAWRAAFLLQAQALVEGLHRVQLRPRPLAGVFGHLRDGFLPECRLTGLDLQLIATDWNSTVAIDEPALVTAATGAILATMALLPDASGSAIKVSATTLAGELRTLDVVQDEAAVPVSVSAVFFDPTWPDRPGGNVAALGAASVKAVAALHGGEAVFMAGARRGSTVRINFAAGKQ
jgi:hypothetical protein